MYLVSASLMSLFGRKVALNVFLTQPPMFGFWGVVLKRLRRQPYVIVLMDVYPDCLIASRKDSRVGSIARFFRWMSRKTWRSADGVVCIGRCMQELVIANGVHPSKVITIPNWADEKRIKPLPHDRNPIRIDRGWLDDFVVLYSGNMGVAHEFTGLLHAAADLSHLDDMRFVFIGNGSRRTEIEQFANEHKLKNLHILPPQPADSLTESQGLGDVHFVCLRKGFTGLMVPSKAYSALAAGRPIIYGGNADGEIALLVREKKLGMVVEPCNDDEVREAILTFYRDRNSCRAAGTRGRRIACDEYSAGRSIKRYADYFEQILVAEKSKSP